VCRKSVHGSTGSPRTDNDTLKINYLAVRPELVEGAPATHFWVKDIGIGMEKGGGTTDRYKRLSLKEADLVWDGETIRQNARAKKGIAPGGDSPRKRLAQRVEKIIQDGTGTSGAL
jgi:hypothetical protein